MKRKEEDDEKADVEGNNAACLEGCSKCRGRDYNFHASYSVPNKSEIKKILRRVEIAQCKIVEYECATAFKARSNVKIGLMLEILREGFVAGG